MTANPKAARCAYPLDTDPSGQAASRDGHTTPHGQPRSTFLSAACSSLLHCPALRTRQRGWPTAGFRLERQSGTRLKVAPDLAASMAAPGAVRAASLPRPEPVFSQGVVFLMQSPCPRTLNQSGVGRCLIQRAGVSEAAGVAQRLGQVDA